MAHTAAPIRRLRVPVACAALLLALSGCTAYHRALGEGDAALKDGQYEAAEDAYQRALAFDPSGHEAKAGLGRARRARALELVGRGDVARQAGELEQAAEAYARAAALDESNPEAPERLRQTLDERSAAGDAALKAGELAAALEHYEAVLRRNVEHTQARMGRDRVRALWAREAFARAEAYEKQGRLGNALVEFVRADQERPGATAARERAAAVRERLRDEVAFWVEMPAVEDRAGAPEVAARLAAGHIAASLPTGVPVRVVTEKPPRGPGVRLEVALERVWTQKDVQGTQKSQPYIAGTRSVVNSKRAEVEAALLSQLRDAADIEVRSGELLRSLARSGAELAHSLDALEKCHAQAREACAEALEECRRSAASGKQSEEAVAAACRQERCGPSVCGAEREALGQRQAQGESLREQLESTQSDLERQRRQVERTRDSAMREPPTVEVPVEAEYIYEVELHRVHVHASVTTRLQELDGTTPSTPITREHVAQTEDTTHRSHEKVGVLVDPLELRSEVELRVAVGDTAAADVASLARARFDAYRTRVVQAALRGSVRAGAEDAVEAAVRALLLTADAPPRELMDPLAAARRLPDPLQLVR